MYKKKRNRDFFLFKDISSNVAANPTEIENIFSKKLIENNKCIFYEKCNDGLFSLLSF